MYTVTEIVRFSYGHRLMEYDGGCGNLHGHNGRAEVSVAAEALDSMGMVRDFDELGAAAREWIGRSLDHKMLLRRDDPFVEILRSRGEPLFVMDVNPTAEAIAELIHRGLSERGIPVHSVRFWETDTSVATYAPGG
jgi:6-pyruvoyltetrahydropterin/6-carboxytetrahydropterin synthase